MSLMFTGKIIKVVDPIPPPKHLHLTMCYINVAIYYRIPIYLEFLMCF